MSGAMGSLAEESFPAWARSVDEVLQNYSVDIARGLSEEEVERRRRSSGFNELQKEPSTPLWKLVLEQFDDMLVKILLLAAIVSFGIAYLEGASGEEGIRAYIEPVVILLILIINAIVGVWQESNAEAALEALKDMQSEHSKVIRSGKLISDLPARELVCGDIVELTVGDKVPADVRLVDLKTATLRAEQSSLTGESAAVHKSCDPVADEECELQLKECMLFSGTAVTNGSCLGVVVGTGMSTEIGKIQEQIQQAAEEEDNTPLKLKLDAFGEMLARVIFYICVTVWFINYHHFMDWKTQPGSRMPDWSTFTFSLGKCTYYFKIAVALAVAAIPEGLPAVITTCLALGTRRMAKKNAIVRKLPSVETLGCTTVICSDKTGTLTTNQMSCVRLVTFGASAKDLREFKVEGHTYNPSDGAIEGMTSIDSALQGVADVSSLCSESRLESKGGVYRAGGNPTEVALKVLVEKMGVSDGAEMEKIKKKRISDPDHNAEAVCDLYASKYKREGLLEFDRERKSMSVLTTDMSSKKTTLFCKGAGEVLIERCSHIMTADGTLLPMDMDTQKRLVAVVENMAGKALRCLALAKKTGLGDLENYNGDPSHPGHKMLMDVKSYKDIESGMTLIGLVALRDPPRPEVKHAIEECREAGIRVIVITGDNQKTAEAICMDIGVFPEGMLLKDKSMIARDFAALSKNEQKAILSTKQGLVFSRAEPKHKQNIVRLLKESGEVTAMTGDGVNDAPALKLADIGVAMGIAGTEVAKEASDMVLADDDFSTIVNAVGEGRSIYNNMKAFIRYMISSNIGEVASIFFTAALGLPEGLIPVQLLWVNLVTDGPPATALGFNPPDVDIMEKPPRAKDENLVTSWIFFRWMLVGTYVGIATVASFVVWYLFDSFFFIDLSQDGHSTVTWHQLTHWEECPTWENFHPGPFTAGKETFSFEDNPCDFFSAGKAKASTLSLSVLVAIEMFNALNALSEDNSLFQMPPWSNPWLLVAMAFSFGSHFLILYVPFLADIFSIVPLSLNEWLLVLLFSLPVVIIDEILKFFGRHFFGTGKVKVD
ncbi:hypothetical protein BSKO_11506 [Bryopsis sp. KO-2023]|nr:hypothetical protein BSKO_11506 [Bryopsis sp. KO-2023]